MATATPITTEVWTYIGQRLASKKIVHAWLDERGEQRLFTGARIKGHGVGQTYRVGVERRDDGLTVHGRPAYEAPANQDDVRLAGWRAEDRATSVMLESARRAKRDAESDELEEALDVVRRHYHAARTWASQAAFLAYVTDQATRPPRAS